MSNVISYKLRIIRIIQEYSQPKIGRKIRIFSLGRKNNILTKKKSVFNFVSCKSLDLSKWSILARTASSLFEVESVLDICNVLDLVLTLI